MSLEANILVVNYDSANTAVIKTLLEEHYNLCFSSSGMEAINLLRNHKFNLIITNIEIGEVDGWRLARLVRSGIYHNTDDTPIIVVTQTWSTRIAELVSREFKVNILLPIARLSELPDKVSACLNDSQHGISLPKLLIIEDNEDTSIIAERTLNKQFQTTSCTDGLLGLETWRSGNYDLVLLDVMLPTISGVEILKTIRKESPNQSVVIMTAQASLDLAVELIGYGAVDFLIKAFEPAKLREVCSLAVRRNDYMISQKELYSKATELRKLEAKYHHKNKMEALGGMASGLSHEINNILAIISTNAEMASIDLSREEYGDVATSLELISTTVDRSKNLIQEVLSFSRQNYTDDFSPLHFVSNLRESIQMITPTIPKRITLNTHNFDKLSGAIILGNRTRLQGVILNLVNNAVHSIAGKGMISFDVDYIELSSQDSNLYSVSLGRYLQLRINDTGTGIPEDKISRVFDPFLTTKDKHKGTGMGLSIAYSVIKSHNGYIGIEKTSSEGTSFIVLLPMLDIYLEESKNLTAESTKKAYQLGKGEQLMIVDDEESLAYGTGMLLEKLGYKVIMFTDSREALEVFKDNPEGINLLISDLSGDSFAEEVKAMCPNLPIVLFGSRPKTKKISKKYQEKFTILKKPIDIYLLSSVLRSLLTKK